MKHIKILALLVCASSLLLAGCKTCGSGKCSSAKPACGHQCCIDGHTDCAHCAKCSKK